MVAPSGVKSSPFIESAGNDWHADNPLLQNKLVGAVWVLNNIVLQRTSLLRKLISLMSGVRASGCAFGASSQ